MNREILFRGKRTDNGKWVYGFYFRSLTTSGKIRHYIQTVGKLGFLDVCYEVLPETVGQYIGLTDKDGKKVFEGDILAYYGDRPDDPELSYVEFSKELREFKKYPVLRNDAEWIVPEQVKRPPQSWCYVEELKDSECETETVSVLRW